MKKLISSTLAAGILLSGAGLSNIAHAETPVKVTQTQSNKSALISIKDLLTKSNINAMKKGTFSFKGAKLNDKMSTLKSKVGKSNMNAFVQYRDKGSHQTMLFQDSKKGLTTLMQGLSTNDSINQNDIKLKAILFSDDNVYDKGSKSLKFRDVSNYLGKPIKVKKYGDSQELTYSSNLKLSIVKKYKTWYVAGVEYTANGYENTLNHIFSIDDKF